MVDSADVSMASVDFDSSLREVELLSDEELYVKLKSTGKEVGPVVDTTRKLYQKQLANIMSSPNSSFYSQGNSSINSNVTNGSTENGFTDSDEEKFDTSSRASRSSRASSSTNKKSDVLFTPRLRNVTKEPEVKKKLTTDEFVARRDSRPKRTFEEYVAESEAKKALYGDSYLRKDALQTAGQLDSDDAVLLASKSSTPLWQIVAVLVVLLAIFAIVYISIMEKKLDQNSIIDQEIEELTKQNQ